MSDPAGLKIALKLIADEAQAKTGKLDLVNLGLSEIPSEIRSLTHLRELLIVVDQAAVVAGQGTKLSDD